MIKANEVNRAYEEDTAGGYLSAVKRHISESPLTAIGVAAGAGLLISGLLRPKPRRQNLIGKAAHAVSPRGLRSSANRTFKTMIGSLALSYLNRRLHSKLRWR